MTPPLYIHVRNWDRYQHPDTTRGQTSPAPWIKEYTGQLHDQEYLELTLAERGLLHGIRLEYALSRGRGLPLSTGSLRRQLGQRVTSLQLERLNDAGFIEVSASKMLAPRKHSASTIREDQRRQDEPLTADAVDPDSDEVEQGDEHRQDEHEQRSSSSPVLELVPPAEERPQETASGDTVSSPDPPGRPRDPLWDLLAERFGPVAERTNAHAKRNRAVADLRRLGATVETVAASLERWPRMFPDATVTDTALATHYPALAPRSSSTGPGARRPPCPSCGVGGGLHVAGCSIAELEERAA